MKKVILFVFIIIPVFGFCQKRPQFNIECQMNSDTAKKYADGFERIMEYYLKDQFSCIKTVTRGDIQFKLERDKFMQFWYGTEMQSYCRELACDYFMILYIQESELGTAITASCIKWEGKEPLARETIISKDNIVEVMKDVCKSMTEKLTKYEICPFEGPVNFEVTSTKDTTINEERSVYCNGMDYSYKKVTTQSGTTHSIWELQKKNKEHADGEVNFTVTERNTMSEEDGCHKCEESEREGGRSLYLSSSLDFNSDGISHDSKLDGELQADARIVLDFLPNDTYTITIKATTNQYPCISEGYIEAIGTCDGIPRKSVNENRKVSAFAFPRFGPYPGKPTDKVLSMQDSRTYYEPSTKERTTISIDYNLTRD